MKRYVSMQTLRTFHLYNLFFSFNHYHFFSFGHNGCWGNYYTTKPLTLILLSFTFQHLSLPILQDSLFFYLMLDM